MHLQDCKTDKKQETGQEKYLVLQRFLLNRATASDEANMEESFIVFLQTQRMVPHWMESNETINHASHLLPIMKEQFHHLLMYQPNAHFRITIRGEQ